MMRLQKFLALSGVASRRNSEKLIADGHVAVNGKVITEMGVQVDESADVVTVDGKVCKIQEEKHYLAYNKPMGEVTTVADPEGRPTVMDKFRDYPVRLYPVGRREGPPDARAHDAVRFERAGRRSADQPSRSGVHHGGQ
mgnify:CR=1 FL=1